LRPVPSPLGPKGFKAPTLPQLYAAVSSPEQRGWLDALQVRLVDMVQDQMVSSLDEREAAVTTRPNSLTWPEFARQAVSALLLNWAEQDAIFGDTSGAPSQSQAAQGRAARKKVGKGGGKIEPHHLSPACVWLDAQHDARHGARFIESITGNADNPPPAKKKVKSPPPSAASGKPPPDGGKEGEPAEGEGGGGDAAAVAAVAEGDAPNAAEGKPKAEAA
ncbi:unnamed protein product, partial [Ectocarpus sp. 13 AM-2016]